ASGGGWGGRARAGGGEGRGCRPDRQAVCCQWVTAGRLLVRAAGGKGQRWPARRTPGRAPERGPAVAGGRGGGDRGAVCPGGRGKGDGAGGRPRRAPGRG